MEILFYGLWLLFVLIVLMWAMTGKWNTYAFCPCGKAHHASFGDEFFLVEVCVKCGRDKYEFTSVCSAKLKFYPKKLTTQWVIRYDDELLNVQELLSREGKDD